VAEWQAELAPGCVGENLSLAGLLEKDVWIGDRLRFANCELLVSEPRFPCFKFNAVMGFNKAVKLMSESAWCGFYLAVHQPGTIAAGERFELLAGPREVTVTELFRARLRRG
jgi:MOSC domain-containing protein YiiM